ncbi:MAG: hypothetical protein EOM55_02125 [Clostridia bacterium]|nr:hypothetical protein [Clostridia bacterium]
MFGIKFSKKREEKEKRENRERFIEQQRDFAEFNKRVFGKNSEQSSEKCGKSENEDEDDHKIAKLIEELDNKIAANNFFDSIERFNALEYRKRLQPLKKQEDAINKARREFKKRDLQDKASDLFELSKEMAKFSKGGDFIVLPPKKIKFKTDQNGLRVVDYNPLEEQKDEGITKNFEKKDFKQENFEKETSEQ